MTNKIGLVFSHLHVSDGQEYKFDILNENIKYFKDFSSNFFIVVCGHGVPLPEDIIHKIDEYYWENSIDHQEIGRGHPKFCIKGYNIMIDNKIEKTVKLRASDLIQNKELFYELLEKENLVITEQTSTKKRMIGDLLMFGDTKKALELWSAQPWDYSKSGLYNLYDNLEKIALEQNIDSKKYLKDNFTYVSPQDIKWYTYENNWDIENKKQSKEFSDKNLWGAIPGYRYYGGY